MMSAAALPVSLPFRRICGMRVDAVNYESAVSLITSWAARRESRYVCIANVHMAMEANDSAEFCDMVNHADLVAPDGMPLVWALRLLGIPDASRVYGPDLTPLVLEAAAKQGLVVGFYGGSPSVVAKLVAY